MKHITLAIFAFFIAIAPILAQTSDLSNIRKLKLEIVLNEMNLNNNTEKKFIPLYNKYSDETLVIRKKIKELEESNKNPQVIIDEREKYKQQILNIEKNYKSEFLKILSASELEKMYKGENKFRETLLKLKQKK